MADSQNRAEMTHLEKDIVFPNPLFDSANFSLCQRLVKVKHDSGKKPRDWNAKHQSRQIVNQERCSIDGCLWSKEATDGPCRP